MAKRSRKSQKAQADQLQGFVVVALTKDMEQAKEYETMLKVNDIPVIIKEQEEDSIGARDIAVMVPEESLDEAHVIIESQDAYDDFYDFALEDEDEMNNEFDNDFFEDELV